MDKEKETQSTEPEKSSVKELMIDDYKFTVDLDLLDNVDAFEIIDRIENKKQSIAVIPLLSFLIGENGYNDMKNYFVKKEGRFRISKLNKIYEIIVANYGPKG